MFSGNITLGNYIHISAYTALYGKYGIEIDDYSGLSSRVTLLSGSDDFSGQYGVGAMLPEEIRNVITGKIILGKYVQIGLGTLVMPEITIGDGSAVGAMSLVNNSIPSWKIAVGVPAKIVKDRDKGLIDKIKSLHG